MALGDVLAQLNPMDFVTGMDRGFETGRKRAVEESLKAEAAADTIRSSEFAAPTQTQRRETEQQLGLTTARFGDLMKNMELNVAQMQQGTIKDTLTQQLNRLRAEAETNLTVAEGVRGRAPAQQQMLDVQQAQLVGLHPEVMARQKAAFAWKGVTDAAGQQNEAARIRVEAATRNASQLFSQTRAEMLSSEDQNVRAQAADPYSIMTMTIRKTKDPDQIGFLMDQQQKIALATLERVGTSVPALVTWLPRAYPGMEVVQVEGQPTQFQVTSTTFVDQTDPATGQVRRVPSRSRETYTLDATDTVNYPKTQEFFAGLRGQKLPFFAPREQKVEPPAPGARGAAATGGAAPATATGQAPAATPGATPSAPAVPAAPVSRTPVQVQDQELVGIERELTRSGFIPADSAKAAGVVAIIRQLRAEQRVANPDILNKLRQLAAQASVPAVHTQAEMGVSPEMGGFNAPQPSGVGLAQATAPSVEQMLQRLIQQSQPPANRAEGQIVTR